MDKRVIAAAVELQLRLQAEDDFYTFVQQAWHIVEPGAKFQGGWAIKAIAEHLQAVSDGEIKRLLINQPPRTGKSSLVSVLWPVFCWLRNPAEQFMCISYAESLAKRDNVKARRLIKSKWFTNRYPHLILSDDQDTKNYVENTSGGHRYVTGVDGSVTGFGANILICFPYDELVWTENGKVKIGDIVSKKMCVKVYSTNVDTGKESLKSVIGWHKNPASNILEVTLNNGNKFRCTPYHKIWTKNRGWVFAKDLLTSDVLPCTSILNSAYCVVSNSIFFCKNSIGLLRRKYFHNLSFSKFAIANTYASCRALLARPSIYRSPVLFSPNLINSCTRYAVYFSKIPSFFCAIKDSDSFFFSKDSSGSIVSHRESSMLFRIFNVIGSCPVSKIYKMVIRWIPIKMTNFITGGARANKSSSHKNVDMNMFFNFVYNKIKNRIPVSIIRRLHNVLQFSVVVTFSAHYKSILSTNAAMRGNAVKSFITGNRFPLLIRNIGHDSSTYCLTVEDNHTFKVGSGQGIVVANCDDLNSVRDGSETMLESAQSFFTDVLPTRFNDFKTGRMVVVQQRTDTRDISGWILANQKKEFVHLCLPMEFEESRRCITVPLKSTKGLPWQDPRKEEGELLWPERFGHKELKLLKSALSSEYAISGQLQQRPAPMEGGMIKRAWWKGWKDAAPPNIRFTIQAWDTAMSLKDKAAYSACLTFGIFKDDHQHDSLILLSAWRKRVEFPDLYKAVQRMARDYRATKEDSVINLRYKPDLILVEEKASGVQLIQTLNKTGIMLVGWRPDKYGDKVERVRRVTHLLESGRVYVPYKAPDYTRPMQYADFLISQSCLFPKGDGADFVDCLTCVLQRCINSGWILHSLESEAAQESEWTREYTQQEGKALY